MGSHFVLLLAQRREVTLSLHEVVEIHGISTVRVQIQAIDKDHRQRNTYAGGGSEPGVVDLGHLHQVHGIGRGRDELCDGVYEGNVRRRRALGGLHGL